MNFFSCWAPKQYEYVFENYAAYPTSEGEWEIYRNRANESECESSRGPETIKLDKIGRKALSSYHECEGNIYERDIELLNEIKCFLYYPNWKTDWNREIFRDEVFKNKTETLNRIRHLIDENAQIPIRCFPQEYELGYLELCVIKESKVDPEIIEKFLPFLKYRYVDHGIFLDKEGFEKITAVLNKNEFTIDYFN